MIFLKKRQTRAGMGALIPTDTPSLEALEKLKNGQVVCVEAKRARSPEQHRFAFALMMQIYTNWPENLPQYDRFNDWRKALLFELGFTEKQERFSGEIVLVAESLAFHNMKQDRFNEFVTAVLDFAESVGFDRADLQKETGQ